MSVGRRTTNSVAPVLLLGGYTGALTKETFVHDNSKAEDQNESTDPTAKLSVDHHRANRPVARYAALGAVPATFLAAGTAAPSPGPTQPGTQPNGATVPGVLHVLGTVAHVVGSVFAEQPLPATGITVAALAAGYFKLRGDWGMGTGTSNGRMYPDGDGFAERGQVKKVMGRNALIKQRRVLRPSLTEVSARHVPTTEVGKPLGRDRKTGVEVFSSIEDSHVLISPMGGGKTALLAGMILDAPGAVVATSSKPDILSLTEGIRAANGGEIWVFNPQQLKGRPTTLHWDPVVGCADPATALRRARYLLEGSDATAGIENRNFWHSASFKVLKSFLWAADVAGLSLLDVARWSKKPHDTPARDIFEKHADVAPAGWQDDLEQTQEVKGKATTLENVFGTLSMTFMCLALPEIVETIEAAHRPDVRRFEVAEFLDSGADTAYLLGRDDGVGGIGPLFSALTGEIYEAARVRASMQRGERNDPPVEFDLDEAAVICPVPLDKWTADSRGLGICVNAAFQSRGQIEQRWGRQGAEIIWDNCTALILGGLKGREHLENLSALTNTRRVRVETESSSSGADGKGSTSKSSSTTKEPVMTPGDIKDLQPGEILIIRKHIKPVVTRFTAVWDRKDVKAFERAGKQAARAARKTARGKTAAPAGNPWASQPAAPAAPADPWPAASQPWAPPAPADSPWTAPAAAASGWVTDGFPGPRSHLRVVQGEVVPSADPAPPVPDFEPTVHLEEPAAAGPAEEQADPAPQRPRNLGAF